MRHLPKTVVSIGLSIQRRYQPLCVRLLPKIWAKNGPKLLTARAKAQRRHKQSRVRFSPKTNVRWRPPPLTTPQSVMRGVSSSATPWQRRVRLRTALAPNTTLTTLLLLSVLVKRVWQRQVNTPPGLVACRVEAHQRYMVGSSNLVFPGPCCRLCRRHSDLSGA